MEWRPLYSYECSKCKKKRRSVFEDTAKRGICRPCKLPKIPEGQLSFL